MNKYKILIVSDIKDKRAIEDLYIAKSFKQDGHIVKVLGIGYDIDLDNKFDVIIRRNTKQEEDLMTDYYRIRNDMLLKRLVRKGLVPVNVYGLQENDLQYLCRLFKEKKDNIVPTITKLKEMGSIMRVWKKDFILKDRVDYIAKDKPIIVNLENIRDLFIEGKYVIQANLKYKSQLQCHLIGNKIMYAFEYTPSKYYKYAKIKLVNLNEKDREIVQKFADISNLKVGMQRLDFVRTLDNELYLSEIKDTNVNMRIDRLDEELRCKVIEEFKKNIYDFLELDKDSRSKTVFARDLYDR